MHEVLIEAENEDAFNKAVKNVDDGNNIEDYVNQLSKQDGITKVEYNQGEVDYDDECEFWNWES